MRIRQSKISIIFCDESNLGVCLHPRSDGFHSMVSGIEPRSEMALSDLSVGIPHENGMHLGDDFNDYRAGFFLHGIQPFLRFRLASHSFTMSCAGLRMSMASLQLIM